MNEDYINEKIKYFLLELDYQLNDKEQIKLKIEQEMKEAKEYPKEGYIQKIKEIFQKEKEENQKRYLIEERDLNYKYYYEMKDIKILNDYKETIFLKYKKLFENEEFNNEIDIHLLFKNLIIYHIPFENSIDFRSRIIYYLLKYFLEIDHPEYNQYPILLKRNQDDILIYGIRWNEMKEINREIEIFKSKGIYCMEYNQNHFHHFPLFDKNGNEKIPSKLFKKEEYYPSIIKYKRLPLKYWIYKEINENLIPISIRNQIINGEIEIFDYLLNDNPNLLLNYLLYSNHDFINNHLYLSMNITFNNIIKSWYPYYFNLNDKINYIKRLLNLNDKNIHEILKIYIHLKKIHSIQKDFIDFNDWIFHQSFHNIQKNHFHDFIPFLLKCIQFDLMNQNKKEYQFFLKGISQYSNDYLLDKMKKKLISSNDYITLESRFNHSISTRKVIFKLFSFYKNQFIKEIKQDSNIFDNKKMNIFKENDDRKKIYDDYNNIYFLIELLINNNKNIQKLKELYNNINDISIHKNRILDLLKKNNIIFNPIYKSIESKNIILKNKIQFNIENQIRKPNHIKNEYSLFSLNLLNILKIEKDIYLKNNPLIIEFEKNKLNQLCDRINIYPNIKENIYLTLFYDYCDEIDKIYFYENEMNKEIDDFIIELNLKKKIRKKEMKDELNEKEMIQDYLNHKENELYSIELFFKKENQQVNDYYLKFDNKKVNSYLFKYYHQEMKYYNNILKNEKLNFKNIDYYSKINRIKKIELNDYYITPEECLFMKEIPNYYENQKLNSIPKSINDLNEMNLFIKNHIYPFQLFGNFGGGKCELLIHFNGNSKWMNIDDLFYYPKQSNYIPGLNLNQNYLNFKNHLNFNIPIYHLEFTIFSLIFNPF